MKHMQCVELIYYPGSPTYLCVMHDAAHRLCLAFLVVMREAQEGDRTVLCRPIGNLGRMRCKCGVRAWSVP